MTVSFFSTFKNNLNNIKHQYNPIHIIITQQIYQFFKQIRLNKAKNPFNMIPGRSKYQKQSFVPNLSISIVQAL